MRRRIAAFTVTTLVATLATVVSSAGTASADVGGTRFATASNASDPHIITCTDTGTNTAGYCLYTSQDMGKDYAYQGNVYPMEKTRVLFSPTGYDQWVDKGTALQESQLYIGQPNGFVPSGARHLWAPSAVRIPGTNTYYLYVPDVSDTRDSQNVTPNIHNSSRIAVAVSTTGPFGPFSYIGTVPYSSGYMSDPDVTLETSSTGSITARHLVWADGDKSVCGGLKYAQLGTDMISLATSAQTLTINGISVLGDCGGKGRPYFEGASLYKWTSYESDAYTLVFAAKPESVPTQCTDANAGKGASNTANEVIAYATSFSAAGPYTYRGIFVCGSTTEWTNQATVTKIGNGKRIMIYHDGPAAPDRRRRLHAECMFSGRYTVGAYRQVPDAANGFNDCVAGTNVSYVALYAYTSAFPPLLSVTSGTGDLKATRYAAGPWERFKFEAVSGVADTYVIRALSNGNLLCSGSTSTPLAPTCTSSSDSKAQFYKQTPSGSGSDGGFFLRSVFLNQYVSLNGDGKPVPNVTQGSAQSFYELKAGA